jgi:alpha-tubulin suppressor-like RCC1 family protein
MNKHYFLILLLATTTNIYSQCWQSIGRIDNDSASTSFGIKEDGSLWAWGTNDGRYGNNNIQSSKLPIQVNKDYDWKSIAYSSTYTLVYGIKTNGTLWAWGGYSGHIGIGDGTKNASLIPKQIGKDTQWSEISTYIGFTLALKNNGTLWVWGYDQLSPIQVGNQTDWNYINNKYAIKNNGTLWEINTSGTAFQVGKQTDFKQIGADWVIKKDGTFWQNISGTYNRVGSETWSFISRGAEWVTKSFYGITTDGSLWEINKGIAKRIGIENNWKAVSVGRSHQIAIKTDGTIYTWGSEYAGELGNGDIESLIETPTIVNTPSCKASIENVSSKNKVNLFPNPTSDVLILEVSDIQAFAGYKYKMLDIQGKEVYVSSITNAKTEIALKSLGAKGVYVLHILDANNTSIENKKIVLE